MKCFLAQIDERNGEYEYSTTIRLRAKTMSSAENKIDRIAKDWYGGNRARWLEEKGDGTYYFNCGEIAVWAGTCVEISFATYTELTKTFIHEF